MPTNPNWPNGPATPEEIAAVMRMQDPAKRAAALAYFEQHGSIGNGLATAGQGGQAGQFGREGIIATNMLGMVGGDQVQANRLATLYTRGFGSKMTPQQYVDWYKSLSDTDRQGVLSEIDKVYTTGDPFFGLTGGNAHGILDRGWQAIYDKYSGAGQAGATPLTQEQQYLKDNQAKIQGFINSMMSPLDPTDPTVRKITNDIQSRAQHDVAGRGIEGGMGDAAVGKVVSDSLLGLQGQRQALGLSAAQGAITDERSFLAQQDAARRAAADAQYQNQLASYETQRGNTQATMGMAGAVLGGIWGGAAGATAGQGLGSSLGGQMAGGPPPVKPYVSSYYGTGGGGGGGLNRGGL